MPDLLVLAPPAPAHTAVVQLGEKRGYRVRETSDRKVALSWLDARRFDLVCVHASLEIPTQQELAGRLWKLNPAAQFVVFDFNRPEHEQGTEVRLYGAELAMGQAGMARIDALLSHNERHLDKNSFRVMVVEDLDSPRDIICAYLEGLGYPAVEGKASAREAMRELEQDPEKFSCVITDMRMPEVTGRDLIDFIRRHQKLQHLPIIVLTAYGTADTLVECLKAGASGFLVKPPKKIDLTRELARAARIAGGEESPRLTSEQDADKLLELLIAQGMA